MAKRFLTSLRLLNLSSDPGSASNGDVYYNSSTNKTKFYQNGSWVNLPSLLGDLSNVDVSGATNGKILSYNGTSTNWEPISTPPATTATGTSFPSSPSNGEFFFNTTVEKLYFFYTTWNEISFVPFSLDGGVSSTTVFEGIFDNGSSSTSSFTDGTYDGGVSTTTY